MGDCTFASLQVKLLPTARFQHISEWDVGRSWHSYPREGEACECATTLSELDRSFFFDCDECDWSDAECAVREEVHHVQSFAQRAEESTLMRSLVEAAEVFERAGYVVRIYLYILD
jgi:hypothetical protein